MRDGMFGPELPPVHECRDCQHQGWPGDCHETLFWCDSCVSDVTDADGLCAECGKDSLTSACPVCGGEWLQCEPDWIGVGRFPRNGDDDDGDPGEADETEDQAEGELVDA